ncbi:BUB3-interacting and GLEBS motif-containing protein ZNF207-like isoform X2 [Coturnix japonica]|uniref:BUB3-interacting and GLEBS motif-containing protein ZNF207-like isoform X2 n=1 Tax=Coturnix japonica TaxID=93934 RepID=UPI0013A5C5ED|nr:BUB3-interacting and GLEBS motif-containing protein ZNF207-like isoform X2 [Coturnix japonica]
MPPNVVQLVPGGQPQSVVQLLPGGQPQTVIQLPPAGMATNVVQLPPGGLPLNVAQLPRGGQPPNVAQLPRGGQPPNVQLPPGVVPMVVGQLPADGQELPLLLLLPGGMKPGMPPPNAPAQHRQHPQRAGTLQPQQPMGLRPGARLHGKRPRSAGSCPMQTPSRPLKKVRREPPRQHQVITVRCSLRTRRAQEGQPLGDAVVQTKDQGNSAPTNVSPKPTTAPLTCSTAAPGSGAATPSSDIPEDIKDLLTSMNSSAASNSEIPDDISDMDDLLAWLNREVASLQEVPQQNQDLDSQSRAELLHCINPTQPPSPAVPSPTELHAPTALCNGSIQATKRKLPQGQDAPDPKRRVWRSWKQPMCYRRRHGQRQQLRSL